jgi:hypothetical protein
LQFLADFYGVEVVMLPPYSPDYNFIEEIFHAFKMFIRRHTEAAKMFKEDFEGFLWWAFEYFMEGKDARPYFRNAQIIMKA